MPAILVADDDNDMCLLLTRFLVRHGYEASSVNNGKAAVSWLKKHKPSLVLCDFRLDDMNGVELMTSIRQVDAQVPVIIITGYSDVKDAVDVMKLGAYDYITKPLYPDEILLTIKKALASSTEREVSEVVGERNRVYLTENNLQSSQFIAGVSACFNTVVKQVDLVAPTNYSVIIYGESGSGKEEVAKQIHIKSKRAGKPFVALDCGALSRELAASELFGHEKGAFTGAVSAKIGSLEVANGGTVFLDEIGNLPYDVQVSLLRVVQERKIRRLGSVKDIELDIRIIVASNENLWESSRAGKFREDLYHRFNEFSIQVPPLRDRVEDIMLFARYFLAATNQELSKDVKGFSQDVEAILKNYSWFGNLRELKNVVKRATLLADGDWIDARMLPFEINNFAKLQFEQATTAVDSKNHFSVDPVNRPSAKRQLGFEERMKTASVTTDYEVILDALKKVNYNKSKAAILLNIDRKTLYNKMRLYNELNPED